MNKRKAGLYARQMGYQSEVHDLLRGSRCELAESGLPNRVDIGMIPENAQGVAGDGPCCDMKDRRHQLARNLVHVRFHQQKPLRRGEGRGKRSRSKRPMNCSRRSGF
ncbi:MAG: hypothetical protein A4E74_02006 [Syntrophus sp. PtaB.Bin075]|nr:MAG: hypothetical protein A4E74_02006 [Syntrophus sp. PtaB.Bin075]